MVRFGIRTAIGIALGWFAIQGLQALSRSAEGGRWWASDPLMDFTNTYSPFIMIGVALIFLLFGPGKKKSD